MTNPPRMARAFLGAVLGLLSAMPAATAAPMGMTWTTLGTTGGPIVLMQRSQPANLLTVGNHHWLVDCGDGCA